MKKYFFCFFLLFLFANAGYSQGIITTVAGVDTMGETGDDGPALSARITTNAVSVDDDGNIYILGSESIRMISASTGFIKTIAGTGTSGYSGDGGPAIGAEFRGTDFIFPRVSGASGTIYISDYDNHVIRGIDFPSGVIYTIAGNGDSAGYFYGGGYSGDGGLAVNARIGCPSSIAFDKIGNMYFIDELNSVVRKVVMSTNTITTVAGTGAHSYTGDGGLATLAAFDTPRGLALDSSDNIYISDISFNIIRKVDAKTGIVSTISGLGTGGDGSLAKDALLIGPYNIFIDKMNNIFMTEYICPASSRVRKIDAKTNIISTVAGTGECGYSGDGGLATNAKLNKPLGIWVDKNKNLYIADFLNYVIRKVSFASGISNTQSTKIFQIVPNPFSGSFTITGNQGKPYRLSVSNILGIRVFETSLQAEKNDIDLNDQPAGMYFATIQMEGQIITQKLVKE